MQFEIKRKTNNIESLVKRVRELSSAKVESGYFKENGEHPTADMSYASLMSIHAFGLYGLPERDIHNISVRHYKSMPKNSLWKDLSLFIKDQKDSEDVLNTLGMTFSEVATGLFGNSSILGANSPETVEQKGFNAPLIEDGFLKNNWSWRNSIDGFIKNTLD